MTVDTLHRKVYRFLDGLPWALLFIYAFFIDPNRWLLAIALVGMFRGALVGWEYPPKKDREMMS